MTNLKEVRDFWNQASCGEIYADGFSLQERYATASQRRYELEPYILEFANFANAKDRDVLEIGVGMGADHENFALANPKSLFGIDLTERAIEHTRCRLKLINCTSHLEVGNAEDLKYPIESFDLVYSWGVLHHSPNTSKAIDEIHRVLRNGGLAKVMIYHKYSLIGFMLWLRYGLLKLRPLRNLNYLYSHYLESPGTKAFSVEEAYELFSDFSTVEVKTILSFGDLLLGEVGQRHKGIMLSLMKTLWPRGLFKILAKRFNLGLYLMIQAKK